MEKMQGYMTFMWLVWKVFVDRGFVAHVDTIGLDAVIGECPFGNDMDYQQRVAFEAAFNQTWLRLIVKLWWIVYDHLRKRGGIPNVQAAPWRP